MGRRCESSTARAWIIGNLSWLANKDNSKAYISFGGLLMSLEGPYKKLTPLRVDYVYLLARKR